MEFKRVIQQMKEAYAKNYTERRNGTLLLGPDKIPNFRHMLFKPLKEEYIEKYLVEEYKNNFPEQYKDFLKTSNGANLYRVKISEDGFSFAHSMLVIFGLPLTPPFGRPADQEEPFDVRVEDLARHNAVSEKWLKCGTYIRDYNFDVQYDIFIDTENNRAYSCERNNCQVVDSWESFDQCLCEIFEGFRGSLNEYSM